MLGGRRSPASREILADVVFEFHGAAVGGRHPLELTADSARLPSGAFQPTIAKTLPLSEIVEAHRCLESNAQVGKVVVTVL